MKIVYIYLKIEYIYLNYTEICCQSSNLQSTTIGPDSGLAMNKGQAIIWKYDCPVHQWILMA